jgi:hypothetical protein
MSATQEPYPLTNAYWKIRRAEEHLQALDAAVKRYISPEAGESKPYTITPYEEPENDAVCYRIELNPPHVYMFLIAADAVQCLRSALDHAIWSLAKLKFPDSDPDWTEFPIFSEEPQTSRDLGKFKKRLEGLSEKAVEYIKSLQPYNRPPGTPIGAHLLYRLHEINRIDKHRRILVRGAIGSPFTSAFGVGAPEKDFLWKVEPTDYGYKVLRFGRYKHIKPNVAVSVVFGELTAGITMPVNGLWEIYEFICNTVLPTLAGFATAAPL